MHFGFGLDLDSATAPRRHNVCMHGVTVVGMVEASFSGFPAKAESDFESNGHEWVYEWGGLRYMCVVCVCVCVYTCMVTWGRGLR